MSQRAPRSSRLLRGGRMAVGWDAGRAAFAELGLSIAVSLCSAVVAQTGPGPGGNSVMTVGVPELSLAAPGLTQHRRFEHPYSFSSRGTVCLFGNSSGGGSYNIPLGVVEIDWKLGGTHEGWWGTNGDEVCGMMAEDARRRCDEKRHDEVMGRCEGGCMREKKYDKE
eukprot:764419-Hanusia_phi.AAC.8